MRLAATIAFAALALTACSAPPQEDAIVASAQSAPEAPAVSTGFATPDPQPPPADLAAAEPAPPIEEPPAPATSHVELKYLIGDIDPANDPMFARIPQKYLGGSRVWGHKDAVDAFIRMAEDAAANGYVLKAVSAFRSFSDQKQIWEDKWNGKTLVGGKKLNVSRPDPKARATKILEFSSMPGTLAPSLGHGLRHQQCQQQLFQHARRQAHL